jgi:hypothetical protein
MSEFTKVAEWPKVLPNDDGIRPAGRPDECFYCSRRIGQEHAEDCVTVQKKVAYNVLIGGKKVGTFERMEPFSWTANECESHKNESSWCKTNAVEEIQWCKGMPKVVRQKQYKGVLTPDNKPLFKCLCRVIEFRFSGIVAAGPLIELG